MTSPFAPTSAPRPMDEGRSVVHVCDWFVKYASHLARGMADHGARVTFLTRDHDLEFGGVPGAMAAFVAEAAEGHYAHVQLEGRVRDALRPAEVLRLRRRLSALGPAIVHYQESVGTDPRLIAAAGVPRRRLAYTIHDPRPHPGDEWPVSRRIAMRVLARAAGVVFVHSERLREDVLASGLTRSPVVVVPHGMDPPDVAPLPANPSLLFFGRISTYYKGLDVLLDAMPEVWRRRPDVTLTVAGAGEVPSHAVLGDSRVTLRNEHVPDAELPALFGAATCAVLPYREASQSGVGSQAKTYGRAIVATDVGGLPELVSEDSGRLVAPGDPAALADAVVEVVTTPGLAESMSRASAAWVTAAGWDRVARSTLDAYDRHLG